MRLRPEAASLPRSFYDRDPVVVAKELLGCLLVHALGETVMSGRIVETEAYGEDDPASHARRGPTPRNRVMFGPPGHLYVYRSYGIHACANIVTRNASVGTAVLLRALEPIEGIPAMRQLRGSSDDKKLCAGPGRLCQSFGIDLSLNGLDLVGTSMPLTVISGRPSGRILATKRIGISVGTNKLWRFIDSDSAFLSRSLPEKNGRAESESDTDSSLRAAD